MDKIPYLLIHLACFVGTYIQSRGTVKYNILQWIYVGVGHLSFSESLGKVRVALKGIQSLGRRECSSQSAGLLKL